MNSTPREGYDPLFLGDDFYVPMPVPGLALQENILFADDYREEFIVDYIHYSVIMSKFSRQALVSAANLDQSAYKTVKGRKWFIDPRIGEENQVGSIAYDRNKWDKGHLTRRTAITWGSDFEAKRASNDSCSYANASPQHENFNRDEWRVPEDIVAHFDKDKNNKLCIFTGPVFTELDRWYTREGVYEAFRIPSAFWKVIVYIDKATDALACQSFLMYQDELFTADRRGRRKINIKNYQVTITEIEKLTGLDFPEVLFENNPLYFYARDGINKGPEGFAVPKANKLDDGLVFSRTEAESEDFKKRKRDILETDL